jgi:transposase InsO family protein
MWPFLEMDGSILHLNRVGSYDKPSCRLVAPPCYRPEIMRQAHAGFTGGHLGERRTVEQVRRRAYWPGWAAQTRATCRHCGECAQYKRGKAPRQGPLQSMLVGMPWERVGIDITGPHPKSRNGFTYMLTVVDYFTKWSDAFPIRNQEAVTVAKVLVDRVFSYFGVPLQIVSDRGANFESHLFNELCRRLNIDHVRTTAYKPSTNGLVERFHRTLNSIMGKVVAENQRDWDIHVPYALAAYRATIHDSTGYTPTFSFWGEKAGHLLICSWGIRRMSIIPIFHLTILSRSACVRSRILTA